MTDRSRTPLERLSLASLAPDDLVAPHFALYELGVSELAVRLGIDNRLPDDREIGDMLAPCDPANWSGPKQFAYLRYDPDVSTAGLAALGLGGIEPQHLQQMDSVDHIADIQRVGKAYADKHCEIGHLTGFV